MDQITQEASKIKTVSTESQTDEVKDKKAEDSHYCVFCLGCDNNEFEFGFMGHRKICRICKACLNKVIKLYFVKTFYLL